MIKKMMMVVGGVLASALPLAADTETVGGYTYTYSANGNTVEISAISPKPTGDLIIPSMLGGESVTCIGSGAFYDCSGLTSVKIPDGVTNIMDEAFLDCSGLTSVAIPDGVIGIGMFAFRRCSGLTNITIPDGTKYIGLGTFSGCNSLTNVTISSSVESIGYEAFGYCPNLTSVIIPDSVKHIWERSFYGCRSLTSVVLGRGMKVIGEAAFYGCSIAEIKLDPGNENFVLKDGILYNSAMSAVDLALCDITSANIENGTVYIAEGAFSSCRKLTQMTIPASVQEIGEQNESVGRSRSGVLVCDGWVFGIDHDNPPRSLDLSGIRGVANAAFYGSSPYNLMHFYEYSWITNVYISASCKYIGSSAFRGLDAVINIEDGVERIGDYAFAECAGLTEIPSSIVHVGRDSFSRCTGLTSVRLPSVTYIGDDSFFGCTNLISAVLPYYFYNNLNIETTFYGHADGFTVEYISPDLEVSNVVLGSDSICPGDTLQVTYNVENKGEVDAIGWTESVRIVAGEGSFDIMKEGVTNVLKRGIREQRTLSCTIPDNIPLYGNVRVLCRVDIVGEFVDPEQSNNEAMSSEVSLIRRLFLSSTSDSVNENDGDGMRFTVKRSGSTEAALTITLGVTDATSVLIPNAVTIPAGRNHTTFMVKPVDNDTVDGKRTIDVHASANGFINATQPLTIIDDEVPHIYLSPAKASIREGDMILETVTRELVTDKPLTVYLAGLPTSRCSYPSSVVIPAGEASATFEISVPNNDTAQPDQVCTNKASSAGYASTFAEITVVDDDVPGVTLSLTPEEVSEGAGPQAIYAELKRSNTNDVNQLGNAVRVRLTASEANRLILPDEITIPAYTIGVRFQIGVVPNDHKDGNRDVTINGAIVIESCGCNGQPSNGDVIRAVVKIIDDDSPFLALKAEPTTMREGLDHAGDLILSHNSTLTEDLVVHLWATSSVTTVSHEIEIPQTVIITAGVTSVRIPVKTLDDGVEDGGQLVSVYAEVDGDTFAPASTWIQVSDQNLPDLTVSNVGITTNSFIGNARIDVSFTIANNGAIKRTVPSPWGVYVVSGTSMSLGDAKLIAAGTTQGELDVSGVESVALSIAAPERPGDYRLAVSADPDSLVAELDEINNTAWSDVFTVMPSYTAMVSPEKEVYLPGERVFLRGVAMLTDGVTPAANREVEVYVLNNPYRRTYIVRTASDGSFEAEFLPVSGEGGHYTVGASYPNISATASSGEFDIIGMRRKDLEHVKFDMEKVGVETSRNVPIVNLSSIPLTGVRVICPADPEECKLVASVPDTISGGGVANVQVTVTSLATTPESVNGYRKLILRIESNEGVSTEFPVYVYTAPIIDVLPRPEISFASPSISGKMVVGETQYREIVLTNKGEVATGEIALNVPTASWLRVLNGKTLPPLAPGESVTVSLELTPDASLTPNSPISGTIQARESGSGCTANLNFSFTPVSSKLGRLRISPVDEYTYWQNGSPNVTGVVITVRSPYPPQNIVDSGKTDEKGVWISSDLPCGVYDIYASEDMHSSWSGRIEVEAESEKVVEPFMSFEAVKYKWEVRQTTVDDRYEVTLVADFVTSVPKPTVLLDVPKSIPKLNAGESYMFNVTAINHGLIAAKNVRFAFQDNFPFKYKFGNPDLEVYEISEIPAKSSVVVPVHIFVPEEPPLAKSIASKSKNVTPPADGELAYNPCSYGIMAMFEYMCGPEIRKAVANSSSIQVAGLACDIFVTVAQNLSQMMPSSLTGGRGDPSPSSGGGGHRDGPSGEEWLDRLNEIPPYSQEYITTNCIMGLKLLECLIDSRTPVGRFAFKNTVGTVSKVERYGYGEKTEIRDAFIGDLEGAFSSITGAADDGGFDIREFIEDHVTLESVVAFAEGRHEDVDLGNSCANAIYYYLMAYRSANKAEMERRRREREAMPMPSARLNKSADDLSGGTESDSADTDLDKLCPPEIQDDTAVAAADLMSIISRWNKLIYILGCGEKWQRSENLFLFANYLERALESANGGNSVFTRLPAFGKDEKSVLEEFLGKTTTINEESIDRFIERWNRTVEYWGKGVFTISDASAEDNKDFIDADVLNGFNVRIAECYDTMYVASGKAAMRVDSSMSIADVVPDALRHMRSYYNSAGGDVCARVSLKFNQSVTIAREAFEGTLTVYNGHQTTKMENVTLLLTVTDAEGNVCNDLFGITERSLGGFTGSSITNEGVSLVAKGTGTATILFVPTAEAAPTGPKIYYFGGKMSYIDPFSGEATTVTLTPVPLMVNPCPKLTLHYFLQQEVFGDDPFTSDIVEPSEPSELALLVVNNGAGAATRMRVHAAQPEKFMNEKGMLVDFNLSNYDFFGAKVNGVSGGSLQEVNLGTIPSNGTAQAQWWLTSSVQGRFTGMSAQFTQLNDWGNPKTCLIDATYLHPLVKSVFADTNDLPDFLVSEDAGNGGADTLYLDDGTRIDVREALNASLAGDAHDVRFDATLRFTADVAGAWYGFVDDPGVGRYEIEKVTDANGTVLPSENFWLRDRRIAETGNPIYGHKLHFFVNAKTIGAQECKITFVKKPSDVPMVTAFREPVDGAVEYTARDTVTVEFSEPIDPETFKVDDLVLVKQGAYMDDISKLTITNADDSGTLFTIGNLSAFSGDFGFYELTVNCVGIADVDGYHGNVGKSVKWVYTDTVIPQLIGLATNNNEFIASFDRYVKVETVTLANVTLQRDGNAVALPSTAKITARNPAEYVLSGIDSVITAEGSYKLTFSASGVMDETGNEAEGVKSVDWIVDPIPPDPITDITISQDDGITTADGIFATNVLTIAGTLPEEDLTVEVICRYAGGGEKVLDRFKAAGKTLSRSVTLSSVGNISLVVRLTDAAGNSSETTESIYVDPLALTAELSGAPENGNALASTITLTFSEDVMAEDVTLDRFSLIHVGDKIPLAAASLHALNGTTFELSGLETICIDEGEYVLRFDASGVRKRSSGLRATGVCEVAWKGFDGVAPTVTTLLFDDVEPRGVYSNGFSSVSVTFSEAMNVPELITSGLIGRAVRIDLLDANGAVTGAVATASTAYWWNVDYNTLLWTIDPNVISAGRARLMIDAGLITDAAGNHLSTNGYETAGGLRTYNLSDEALAQVHAQAMPMWHGGELYVGEKTTNNKGKIRHYTADRSSWAYLTSGETDIEIPAEGCQGASVSFADMDGDGLTEIYVGNASGEVLKYPGGDKVLSLEAKRAMPCAYDMDGDGRDELVVGDMDGKLRVVFLNPATGEYSTEFIKDVKGSPIVVPNGRAAPVMADINHDGCVDIVSGDTAGNVCAYLGYGKFWCAEPVELFTNSDMADRSRLGYGDVDGDGIEDIIVGRSDGTVRAMFGRERLSPIVQFTNEIPHKLELTLAASGWNQISFSVLPDDASPENVFAEVLDKIEYVVSGSENWHPGKGGSLQAISIGVGYWVSAKEKGVSWTLTGYGRPGVEIRLKAGWTMIGYPLLEERPVEEALATAIAAGKVEYITKGSENWSAGKGGSLTTLKPGHGYWVYAPNECVIIFDNN